MKAGLQHSVEIFRPETVGRKIAFILFYLKE